MRAIAHIVIIGGALSVAVGARAQSTPSTYSCRDHTGRMLTSDRPIQDCAGTMRELSPTGVVRREIAPPLTAEQQRAKEANDRARRDADDALREKRRRDNALLAAYSSEDQIETARRRALADTNDSIRESQARLEELGKEKKALQQEADAFKGKPMTPLFRRRMEDNQALIDDEETAIRQRHADLDRVNRRYDDDLRRYRELNATR